MPLPRPARGSEVAGGNGALTGRSAPSASSAPTAPSALTAAADPSAPSRMTWARRATVVSPRARVDVALPVQCTVAELVPELVRLSDAQRHAAPGHAGWVVSRLGGAPLPPDLNVAAAGVR